MNSLRTSNKINKIVPSREDLCILIKSSNNQAKLKELIQNDTSIFQELTLKHNASNSHKQHPSLETELLTAKKVVDKLMRTRVNSPGIDYQETHYNTYRHETQMIMLEWYISNLEKQPTIRHEYTHHLQHMKQIGTFQDKYDSIIFIEGQATGVGFQLTQLTIPEQISVLTQRIKLLNKTNTTQICDPFQKDTIAIINSQLRNFNDEYSLGYAAFRLAESRYGTRIYADTLREPMLLLDVLRQQ